MKKIGLLAMLFSSLVIPSCSNFNGYTNSADRIVSVIDKYNVTTFNELHSSMIKQYPSLKTKIDDVFKTYYVTKGSKDGNVITYQ